MPAIQPEQKNSGVTFLDSGAVLSSYKVAVITANNKTNLRDFSPNLLKLITPHWPLNSQKKKKE